jgi:hypothetical protein
MNKEQSPQGASAWNAPVMSAIPFTIMKAAVEGVSSSPPPRCHEP